MVEKRRSSRLQLSDKHAKVHRGGALKDVPLVDVSSGGMKIVLLEDVPAGTIVKGEFSVMPQQGAYYIQGEVVWSKMLPDEKRYEVGIKFFKVKTSPIV